VTLGDRCIKVHRRHRTGICRHVVVATDCIVPAKHEANVLVCMEDDGLPLPPYDWALEPQGLGPNVMTACTLFSDSQPQLVARVLNNSCEDKLLHTYIHTYIREIYNAQHGRACSSNRRRGLLLGGSLGKE